MTGHRTHTPRTRQCIHRDHLLHDWRSSIERLTQAVNDLAAATRQGDQEYRNSLHKTHLAKRAAEQARISFAGHQKEHGC